MRSIVFAGTLAVADGEVSCHRSRKGLIVGSEWRFLWNFVRLAQDQPNELLHVFVRRPDALRVGFQRPMWDFGVAYLSTALLPIVDSMIVLCHEYS